MQARPARAEHTRPSSQVGWREAQRVSEVLSLAHGRFGYSSLKVVAGATLIRALAPPATQRSCRARYARAGGSDEGQASRSKLTEKSPTADRLLVVHRAVPPRDVTQGATKDATAARLAASSVARPAASGKRADNAQYHSQVKFQNHSP